MSHVAKVDITMHGKSPWPGPGVTDAIAAQLPLRRRLIPKTPTSKVQVYTLAYFPFTMGGNVWQPIACVVDATGPYAIGRGYRAYVVTAPNGETFVAEAETGAFVGPSLKQVRREVRAGDPAEMDRKIAKSRTDAANARAISADEFWRKLSCLVAARKA